MTRLLYRRARPSDIPAMADIRAGDWGTPAYWRVRITLYLSQDLHPKETLLPRIAFICADRDRIVGLIAGHLTHRFDCHGELEWISVRPRYRSRGVASQLLRRLSRWFVAQRALRICVDVEPSNLVARRFYARHGASDLKPHWMIWEDIRRALAVPRRS